MKSKPKDQLKSQSQQALALIKKQGVLRSSDLAGQGIPRVILTRLSASGQVERVGKGLYRLSNQEQLSEHEGLVVVATKVPQAVFCLLTALDFHGLTTQLPRQVWLAMPKGSHTPRIDYPPLRMVQFSGKAYSEGIELHERDGVRIRVYGIAKTVADCFKYRNKIGFDVALEALKEAREQRKVSMDELWRFAQIDRVTNVMRPYLEMMQ